MTFSLKSNVCSIMHSGNFNTCNRLQKWKNFHQGRKRDIGYSSILKEKRDFQHSMEKHTIEISNWSKMNSCCILDNSVNGQNMDLIFLDEYDCCSSLALRLCIQKQLLMKQSNSLLVFLRKLKKSGTYKLQNTFIYIKCADSLKWPLFYDLFEFLLKRLGRSVIGSQFYIHFVCKDLIYKELCFSQKIKENQGLANFIQSLSEYQTRKMRDSEITSFKKQLGIKVCSEYKPKVGDSKIRAHERNIIAKCKPLKSSHNFSQKVCCKYSKNKWQIIKPSKHVAYNYTNILEVMLNELEVTQTSVDSSIYSSTSPKVATFGVKEMNLIPSSSVYPTVTPSNITKEMSIKCKPNHIVSEAISNIDINLIESVKTRNASDKCIEKENANPKNNDILQHSLDALGNNQSIHGEILSVNVDHKKCSMKPEKANSPKIFSEKTKCNQKDSSFMMFQTASGKALKISEQALQIAQKMYSEVCSQVKDTTKNEENSSFSNLQEKVEDHNYKHYSGFSSASKSTLNEAYLGDNMDTSLDDRFFEEISFDEEVNCKPYDQSSISSSVLSNTSSKSQSGKVKKSLGGRRSLKPYIKKLSYQ